MVASHWYCDDDGGGLMSCWWDYTMETIGVISDGDIRGDIGRQDEWNDTGWGPLLSGWKRCCSASST